MSSNQNVSRVKLAELTSLTGAAVLGLGVGVVLAPALQQTAWLIGIAGLFVHAWGMTDKHRLERSAGVNLPRWSNILYWVCWLLLLAVAVVVAVGLYS